MKKFIPGCDAHHDFGCDLMDICYAEIREKEYNMKTILLHPQTLTFKETKNGIDGIDFINVYSKGATLLGRLLSNFAHTPFTYKNIEYQSVEAFWYYTKTGNKALTKFYGINAKLHGERYEQIYPDPSKEDLWQVYFQKLKHNPEIVKLLLENRLPFAHFYVMNGTPISADKYLWTADLWRIAVDFLLSENTSNHKTQHKSNNKNRSKF